MKNLKIVRYEVFMVMKLHPEDGGSMVLRNNGILQKHYMAPQPRRP
jgi:hypothetical protein